ncbi:MAG TPA: amidohydrolase family protein [Gemmatimonadaceae bacterium]|nr:amidohydrolase family protein [Gemmatimonadaceae bacterium]
MRPSARAVPLLLLAIAACHVNATRNGGGGSASSTAQDTVEARRLFERNVDAIHKRDRARYLASYLQTDALTRNGPGGIEMGFADWPARRDTTWPDTLVARDLRLVPVAPGVVYGTYHYRVTQGGAAVEGISERVFVRTPDGWRIAVSTAFGLPAGAAPPPAALVGGTLVNPGAPAVPDAVVLVRGGRVVCAGVRDKQCAVPPNVETVDVSGKFVSPGLIDAHVHYSQTGWVDGRPDALDVRAEYPWDSVAAALRAHPQVFGKSYLCSGVTATYDVGGFPWTIPMAQGSAARLDMPRVAAVGPLLSTIDHWLNVPDMRQFVHMRDDSAVRAAVREQKRMGASSIKVWYIWLPDSLRPRARALLMAAGEEARAQGLPLIVHATQLAAAKHALEAGATLLVHSVETDTVDGEFIALARRNGAVVIPTLTVREGYGDVFRGRSPAARYPLECVDPETRAKLERVLPAAQHARVPFERWDRQRAIMEENLRRLTAAGIPIATGTDAGNPGTAHGPSIYREMEAMQAAGMSAAQVFASSTIVAARAMGLEREIGSLEAGKRADLVVFDADPSADVANARRVHMVVRGGALYGRTELLPR